jgi:hypothetical protein
MTRPRDVSLHMMKEPRQRSGFVDEKLTCRRQLSDRAFCPIPATWLQVFLFQS